MCAGRHETIATRREARDHREAPAGTMRASVDDSRRPQARDQVGTLPGQQGQG